MTWSDLCSAPSKYNESKILSKSDEVLILGPIFPNIDSRYKIQIYQCEIRDQCLQMD